jgi:hypothetical protein
LAHPEDTNGVERAVRWPVGLDHAEHAMQLPVDEEDNEEMVGVPESLKVLSSLFLSGSPSHSTESNPHDPTSDSGSGLNAEQEEVLDAVGCVVGRHDGEPDDVDDMSQGMYEGPEDDGPASGLVEGDVFVERNEVVKGRATEEGDEVTADREENEDDVDVTE